MSSSADAIESSTYDGIDVSSLATTLRVPRVVAFAEVPSTMDVAHALADGGAPAGTLVIADAQSAGRGRAGRRWASHPGAGIWLTLVERPADAASIDVLSLRLGIAAADAVDRFAHAPVRLKWPNDLHLDGRKLAGVLVEARWRDGRPEWVAIGVGMNVVAPADVDAAAGLRAGTARLDALRALVPALRHAAAARGPLTQDELAAYAARDLAVGRAVVAPAEGRVRGLTPAGELLVEDATGRIVRARHGSLIFADADGEP